MHWSALRSSADRSDRGGATLRAQRRRLLPCHFPKQVGNSDSRASGINDSRRRELILLLEVQLTHRDISLISFLPDSFMQSVFRSGSRCVSRFRTARVFSSACSAGCGRRFGCGLLLGAGAVLAGSAGVAIATKPEGESHSWFTLVGPLFRTVVPPEAAHRLAVLALTLPRTLRSLLLCVDDAEDDAVLRSTVWDTSFPNPLGMAAGFDKNGEAIEGSSISRIPISVGHQANAL